jgi:hypothetical protein
VVVNTPSSLKSPPLKYPGPFLESEERDVHQNLKNVKEEIRQKNGQCELVLRVILARDW